MILSDHKSLCLFFTLFLAACGGGGGGSSNAEPEPTPAPSNPTTEPTTLTIVDAQPGDGLTMITPTNAAVSFSHPGQSDLTITLSDDCMSSRSSSVRRAVFDLSGEDADQVIEYDVR